MSRSRAAGGARAKRGYNASPGITTLPKSLSIFRASSAPGRYGLGSGRAPHNGRSDCRARVRHRVVLVDVVDRIDTETTPWTLRAVLIPVASRSVVEARTARCREGWRNLILSLRICWKRGSRISRFPRRDPCQGKQPFAFVSAARVRCAVEAAASARRVVQFLHVSESYGASNLASPYLREPSNAAATYGIHGRLRWLKSIP